MFFLLLFIPFVFPIFIPFFHALSLLYPLNASYLPPSTLPYVLSCHAYLWKFILSTFFPLTASECLNGCTPKITGLPLQTRYALPSSNVTEVILADYHSYECGRRGKCDYLTGQLMMTFSIFIFNFYLKFKFLFIIWVFILNFYFEFLIFSIFYSNRIFDFYLLIFPFVIKVYAAVS